MKTYTHEEVEILLEKQRQLCADSARIERFEYVNPYSESDGEIETRVSKESIMNAKLKLEINLKNKKVLIPNEFVEECLKFVDKSKNYHESHGRKLITKERDIFKGKLAECAYKFLCDACGIKCSDINFENMQFGDGGFDFIVDGEKKDVKSIDDYDKDGLEIYPYSKKERVFIPFDKPITANSFVLIRLQETNDGYYATYIGQVYYNTLERGQILRQQNGVTYLYKQLFEESKN